MPEFKPKNKKFRLVHRSRLLLMALFCIMFFAGPADLAAQPNHYESQLIREKILTDFHILIDTWTEELYFEMYQLGDLGSKGILSQGEFAQRMVDLQWKPTLSPLQNEKVTIIYRNFASIEFDQQFENKVNQTQTIWKRMIFSTVLENKTWKFNLKQLINIPYEGEVVDPEAERKAAEKAKAEAERIAKEKAAQAQQAAEGDEEPGAGDQQQQEGNNQQGDQQGDQQQDGNNQQGDQ